MIVILKLLKKQQTAQLKSLINEDDKDIFDIFYAPSGSDLCYFPLIFSKLLYPDKDICNLVTCPEELGSGSRLASQGKYYFDLNQYGNTKKYYWVNRSNMEISHF